MGRLTYSASGAVASFKAAGHVPVRHAKFNFTPTQDLHGYDSPWPAGGGKNLFNAYGFVRDVYGITFSYTDHLIIDGTVETAFSTTWFIGTIGSPLSVPIPENTQLVFSESGTDSGGFYAQITVNGESNDYPFGNPFTLSAPGILTAIRRTGGFDFSPVGKYFHYDIYIQMEKGSTATSYTPYSNICPISGWTGLTGYKDSKHGGMIQWNQLYKIDSTSRSIEKDGLTFTDNRDGTYTIDGTADARGSLACCAYCPVPIGHVFIVWGHKATADTFMGFAGYSIDTGNGRVWKNTTTYELLMLRVDYSIGAVFNNVTVRPQYCDLTQMFGSTIADYIYSLETANAGAGVAWFRNLFPLDYYAYNAGTQTTVDAVNGKTDTMYPITFPALGVNQWDEEWELGSYNTTTGEKSAGTDRIRSKNFIPVVAGQTYYVVAGTAGQTAWQLYLLYYDANKNYLGSFSYIRNATKTIPENCCYVTFNTTGGYGTTYANNISINYPSTDTSYHPYTNTVYGGYVDLVTGEVWKTWAECAITSGTDNGTIYGLQFLAFQAPDKKWGTTNFLSNIFTIGFDAYMMTGRASSNVVEFRVPLDTLGVTADDPSQTRVAAVISWLSDNPTRLAYELATPALVTTLTPTELQTFIGENHIWSNANGNTVIEYDAHEATEVFLARKRLIEENSPVERTATGAVASFTTRSNLPLKECKCEFSPVQDLHGETAPYPAGGGVNIWDEEWETGQYNPSSGEPQTANNAIRSKNFIPIMPSTTYYCHMPSGVSQRLFWYDSETNWIGTDTNASFTTPANAQYMKFHTSTGYGGTYNHDISINYPSTDTSYHPYANICPITGWTGVNVSRTGFNLFDFSGDGTVDGSYRLYDIPIGNTNKLYMTLIDKATGTAIPNGLYMGFCKSDYINGVPLENNEFRWILFDGEIRSNHSNTGGSSVSDGTKLLGKVFIYPNTAETLAAIKARFDVCISFHDSSRNGEYEPYSGNVYPCSFGGLTKNLLNQSDFVATSQTVGYYNTYQAGTYTVSFNVVNSTAIAGNFRLRDENNINEVDVIIPQNANARLSGTFTLEEEKELRIIVSATNSGYNFAISNIQVEAGSTATSYEPYGTIYGGYVDPVKGVAVATYGSVDLGTLTWGKLNTSSGHYWFRTQISDLKPAINGITLPNLICTVYNTVTANDAYSGIIGITANSVPGGYLHICDESYSESTDFKTSLSGVQLVYELATPITYQLTPQQIRSLIGQNNVFSDVNGNTTVKYWKL